MKIKFFIFICSFSVLTTAYSQKVLSLHPLFIEQDAVLIPEIEGSWSIPDFDMDVSFQKAGDNFYLLKYGSEINTSIFEAVFVKIKDEIYLANTAADIRVLGIPRSNAALLDQEPVPLLPALSRIRSSKYLFPSFFLKICEVISSK